MINFFSLNFTSIEIESERVSSSQNERTCGGGVLVNEQGQTRGREGGVKTRESWANVLFDCPLNRSTYFFVLKSSFDINSLIAKLETWKCKLILENVNFSLWFSKRQITYKMTTLTQSALIYASLKNCDILDKKNLKIFLNHFN